MENRLFANPQFIKQLSDAWQTILNAKRITLLTHARPDPDGVSACAALSLILEKMGKEVECVYPTTTEFVMKRQPRIVFVNEHKQTPDLLIACDTANVDRLYYPPAFAGIPLINIDHHVSNAIKGTFNFIDPTAASTCEFLYEIFGVWDKKLVDLAVAEALLYGILYDTQAFHTQSVVPKSLRVSADLMAMGANMFELKNELFNHKDPRIINLWADLMKNIQYSPQKKAAWASLKQADLHKYGLQLSSLVGFNNFLAEISGIDVSLLFYETETGQTKVSLRSKKTDVNKLAAQFGGGGHRNASGILSDMPMNELIEKITAQL